MKLALVSDAWAPQVNGVVRTLSATVMHLRAWGHQVELVTPDRFRTVPCPTYPEIRLAVAPGRRVAAMLEAFVPDAVHIATEGPLGWAARGWCLRAAMPFTTSFHTHFADYVALRTGLPSRWFWPVVHRFHVPAARVFAATPTLEEALRRHGIARTHRWARGVDLGLFTPDATPSPALRALPGPIQLYVGRVAVEKNLPAFLSLDVPGTKVIVGDGPARADLQRRFPAAQFLGALHGHALASAYAAADLFVFPSLTDTFGLVLLEALASGVPVAAFPVAGPLDVIGPALAEGQAVGALDADLAAAVRRGLVVDRAACVRYAAGFSWAACSRRFVAGLAPVRGFALAHRREPVIDLPLAALPTAG